MYLCLESAAFGASDSRFVHTGSKGRALQDFSLALHEISASLSYLLIAMHVGAAIWSRVKERCLDIHGANMEGGGASRNELVTRISKLENEVFNRVRRPSHHRRSRENQVKTGYGKQNLKSVLLSEPHAHNWAPAVCPGPDFMPMSSTSLRVFEPRYKQMMDDCILDSKPFGYITYDPDTEDIGGWTQPVYGVLL